MIRQRIINCLDFAVGDQVFVRAVSFLDAELLCRVFCSREVARCDRSNFAPVAFLHSGNYFSRCDGRDAQHAPLHSVLIHCGTLSPGTTLWLPGTNLQGPLYSMKRGAAAVHYCSSGACQNIFKGVLLCAHPLK